MSSERILCYLQADWLACLWYLKGTLLTSAFIMTRKNTPLKTSSFFLAYFPATYFAITAPPIWAINAPPIRSPFSYYPFRCVQIFTWWILMCQLVLVLPHLTQLANRMTWEKFCFPQCSANSILLDPSSCCVFMQALVIWPFQIRPEMSTARTVKHYSCKPIAMAFLSNCLWLRVWLLSHVALLSVLLVSKTKMHISKA